MKPVEYLIKHKAVILEAREKNNGQVKQTWNELNKLLPDLAGTMSFNTFKQYLSVFAEVVQAVEAEVKQNMVNQTETMDKQEAGEAPRSIEGWNVVQSGGYYRAFRKINGRVQGVYLGKQFDVETARVKVQAKEKEIRQVEQG